MSLRLTIPRATLDEIVALAKASAPHECCGVLAGRRAKVERFIPVKNAADDMLSEYAMDPDALLAAILKVESEWGIETLGFYHSHPLGPQGPSRVDVERATWPRMAQVIVWLAPAPGGVGAWRLDEGRADPIELLVE